MRETPAVIQADRQHVVASVIILFALLLVLLTVGVSALFMSELAQLRAGKDERGRD